MRYFVCSCFYTHNYFIKELGCHVVYRDRGQFLRQYEKILLDKDIKTEAQCTQLINQIEKELARRKKLGEDYLERKAIIDSTYRRVHPDIFVFEEKFLAPEFLKLVNYCKQADSDFDGVLELVQEVNGERIYTFPVFVASFCEKFLEELHNFENSDCPKGRPNTMNNYGINLDELGFDDFISSFRENYLQPIAQKLFLDSGGGKLDSHKAFTVKYEVGSDVDLSYHYDNAEVTLNVAMSSDGSYTGGDLYFGDMRNRRFENRDHTVYQHKSKIGVFHRGQHMHGARPIESGERVNLIIWMRASAIRNHLCPMCDRKPDLMETVGKGDGFTVETKTVNVCHMI